MTALDAMRMVLEALEEATTYTASPVYSPSMTEDCNKAITALRNAIAKYEKAEPVARVTGYYGGRVTIEYINPAAVYPVGMALYTHPAASQELADQIAGNKVMVENYERQIAELKAQLIARGMTDV